MREAGGKPRLRSRGDAPAPDASTFTPYLVRRRVARRIYGASLVVLFGGAFWCVATGTYSGLPQFVAVTGVAVLAVAVACEWYLHRSRCPRCGQRFAGSSLILQSVALLTAKYRACQSCNLSEDDLADEPLILDSDDRSQV
jgi:hypothetical protein